MSNYLTKINHEDVSDIEYRKFSEKSVLIIGSGWMAEQYAYALHSLNIKNVTILGNTKEKVSNISQEFGFNSISGGYDKNLRSIQKHDLTIIATPVHLLSHCLNLVLETNQDNILVEKPGGLYSEDFLELKNKTRDKTVKVGYNRLCYPSFLKLKSLIEEDGGITSCTFSFSEWIHKIDFKKYQPIVYQRWGIANSLHVIAMACDLIGFPKKLSAYQKGCFDWHNAGSKFVGSGISVRDIPFSYHSDWESAGRWELKVMTKKRAFHLIPLEKLFVCHKGSTVWEEIPLKIPVPQAKPGIVEEVALMIDAHKKDKLIGLDEAEGLITTAEKIFGYKNNHDTPKPNISL